ncbi:MAG: hypothetical protein EPN97_16790 [Alphaproteobacteria bacterium]|nr:MAG: hypothetical protein EPN97_16790 [Alphaproteobacteria bacterium]
MRRMDPHQISDTFNAKRKQFAEDCDATGLAQGMEAFSIAINDLKAAGMDLSVEIFGDASELAFSMFNTTSLRTPVSGILHIGPIHRLFAFAVRDAGGPCLKLAVSDFDIRFNGADGTIKEGKLDNIVRAQIYDLKNDENALVTMQDEIIRMSARNEVVQNHDVADAFDKPGNLRKPSLRMTPKSS